MNRPLGKKTKFFNKITFRDHFLNKIRPKLEKSEPENALGERLVIAHEGQLYFKNLEEQWTSKCIQEKNQRPKVRVFKNKVDVHGN